MKFEWKLNPPCNGKVYGQTAQFSNETYQNVRFAISKVTIGGRDTYELTLQSFGMEKGTALQLAHKLAEAMNG